MFEKNREVVSNMALTVTVTVIFDKPIRFGSNRFDPNNKASSITTNYKFHTINDINNYYPFIKETPRISSGELTLTVTGNLSGIDINKTFNDLDSFNDFLLQNNILPPCAHKKGFCPLF